MASATVTLKVSVSEMDLIKATIEARMRALETLVKDEEIPVGERHNYRAEHLQLDALLRQLA